MTRAAHCSFAGCDQAVVSSLEGEELCLEHFISVCYGQLDRYAEIHKGQHMGRSDTESMRRFVQECVRQADAIQNGGKDLDQLERALIVHIIERATDLGLHLRRSPRKKASVAVRLCGDRPGGGAWKEDTETLLLSRYGASLRCSRPADPRESLQIVRLDTGKEARARVAWQRPSLSEGSQIGVEFLDCDNFWGLDWIAVEEAR